VPVLNYLADTNAISDFLRGEQAVKEWFFARQDQVAISTLSVAEMRRGIELKAESKTRRELERNFRFLMEDFRGAVLVFDEAAAVEWGRLMAEAKKHPLPYEDSLIAAIARSVGLRVVTRNLRHFPGCETVDPWTGTERSARCPPS
jgi:toxin FitB